MERTSKGRWSGLLLGQLAIEGRAVATQRPTGRVGLWGIFLVIGHMTGAAPTFASTGFFTKPAGLIGAGSGR